MSFILRITIDLYNVALISYLMLFKIIFPLGCTNAYKFIWEDLANCMFVVFVVSYKLKSLVWNKHVPLEMQSLDLVFNLFYCKDS